MPNQVRILVGSHTEFSLFVTNPALIRVLRTKINEVSDFEDKICLVFIRYIDMVTPTLQVEFKQVAFITFQIILKTIPIIKFYFVFNKMIIYISEV